MASLPPIPLRRTDTEAHQAGDHFDSSVRRYYDHNLELTVVKIHSGDCYIAESPDEMLVTILGSCVAVCARDPVAEVAGMNHFLLPGCESKNRHPSDGAAARFGVQAMEQLINGLLKRGAHKHRLEFKAFGGGNVMSTRTLIGDMNSAFVLGFFKKEGLPLAAHDLGGTMPRRIHYLPASGKVMQRKLRRAEDMLITEHESRYAESLKRAPVTGSVELFDE